MRQNMVMISFMMPRPSGATHAQLSPTMRTARRLEMHGRAQSEFVYRRKDARSYYPVDDQALAVERARRGYVAARLSFADADDNDRAFRWPSPFIGSPRDIGILIGRYKTPPLHNMITRAEYRGKPISSSMAVKKVLRQRRTDATKRPSRQSVK